LSIKKSQFFCELGNSHYFFSRKQSKSLVALATLVATTGAFAQVPTARGISGSNVEIFGVADATITRLTASNGGSIMQMSGDGRNESTRLGFRGVEDMGGGWGAAFWLEAAYDQDRGTGSNTTNNNTAAGDRIYYNSTTITSPNAALTTGTSAAAAKYTAAAGPVTPGTISLASRQGLTFNRAATVSLINRDLGEIRLGRDYTASFWNWTSYDPFGTVGVGSQLQIISGPLALMAGVANPPGAAVPHVRTSNSISWLSQDYSGFRAQVQVALAEQPSTCTYANADSNTNYCFAPTNDGKLTSFRLRYNQGPLDVAYANTLINYGSGSVSVAQPNGSATASTTQTQPTAAMATGTTYAGNNMINSLAGSYQVMPALKLMGQYNVIQRDVNIQTVQQKLTHMMLGAAYTMGNTTLKLSVAKAKRADGTVRSDGNAGNVTGNAGGFEDGAKQTMTAVGFVHDLSKRTALYGTYSRSSVAAGAISGSYTAATTSAADAGLRAGFGFSGPAIAPGTSQSATGLDFGLRHRF
jgi:predicted porin